MKITEMQYASLTISLSTLGQSDLADNDPEALRTLAYLLEEASKNVQRALTTPEDAGEPLARTMRIAKQFDELREE